MSKEFELFRSLFEDSPNIAILNINNNCDDIANELRDITNDSSGEFVLKQFSDIDLNRFKLKNRNFEYAIISNCLNDIQNQDRFITGVYHSLENSAFIILIEPKQSSDISAMIDLLDRNNFRAVNDINIFDKYNLVMAKKLHMWGAGQ